MKFGCLIGIFLNSANLICRSTDISKCFRGSLRFRDNESRLYIFVFRTILEPDLSSEDEPIPTPIRKRIQRPQRSRNENQNLTDTITSRRKGAKQARRCEHCKYLKSIGHSCIFTQAGH